MSGKAIGISMNFGYPGNYARTPDDIVASRLLNEESEAIPVTTPALRTISWPAVC